MGRRTNIVFVLLAILAVLIVSGVGFPKIQIWTPFSNYRYGRVEGGSGFTPLGFWDKDKLWWEDDGIKWLFRSNLIYHKNNAGDIPIGIPCKISWHKEKYGITVIDSIRILTMEEL